jgi:putative transcriptional regulator
VRSLRDGTVVQVLPDGSTVPIEDKTDWARLEAMTEEEIEANALADPDNPPLTDEELARMRRVPHPKRIREKLKLTQEEFSDRFEVPLGTLRDWEQGVSKPDRAARTLLRVIEQDPEGVVKALEKSYLLPIPSSPNSR